MKKDYLLIGVDGGATKVSAWEVLYDEKTRDFSLGKNYTSKSYREVEGYISDYKPVDLNTQLNELNTEFISGSFEKQQAGVYIETCALAIKELVEKTGMNNVLIGLGMPGLKTQDKRGITALANGPRMVDYSDKLEQRLAQLNVKMIAPIAHLGSDADYCGIGENYAEEGEFRNTTNAYYLGGGTGVADAMKLDGELLPFDMAKAWIPKSWEIKCKEGVSMERITAVGGIQNTYAEIAGKSVEELNKAGIFPQQVADMAAIGDDLSVKTFEMVNRNLAELLYERIVTLNKGWKGLFDFVNPNKPPPEESHPYLNHVFDKIIIGQRLGDLFISESGSIVVRKVVIEKMNKLIQNSPYLDQVAKDHYKDFDSIIVSSKLREAPALGAGIDAYLSMK